MASPSKAFPEFSIPLQHGAAGRLPIETDQVDLRRAIAVHITRAHFEEILACGGLVGVFQAISLAPFCVNPEFGAAKDQEFQVPVPGQVGRSKRYH